MTSPEGLPATCSSFVKTALRTLTKDSLPVQRGNVSLSNL